jgi:DnaJ-domain-containing protein 1
MKWRDLSQSTSGQKTSGQASSGPSTGQRVAEMKQTDPYALLKVERGADLADIKRAYRGLVKTYHPDQADPFMRTYCLEVLKIINRAMAHIEREYRNGLAR